jgi:hypothetical protein
MMPKCKTCGATINFIRTLAGKNMPVNETRISVVPKKIAEDIGLQGKEATVVTIKGEVYVGVQVALSADHPEARFGRVPHWATCNEPDKHRKSRKKKPPPPNPDQGSFI